MANTQTWYTGGDPEQGFQLCLADELNQSLVSSIAQTNASKLDTTYSTDFQLRAVIPNRTRSLANIKRAESMMNQSDLEATTVG